MNELSSDSASEEEVFCQFFEELEATIDKQAVLQKYAAAYPRLATEFRNEAVINQVFHQAPTDPGLPGLTELPDFHIVRELGRGGMGVVYEAMQLCLGRRVPLKHRPGFLMVTGFLILQGVASQTLTVPS
jgi:hypothetical protein